MVRQATAMPSPLMATVLLVILVAFLGFIK
jgi:hypothetical protein